MAAIPRSGARPPTPSRALATLLAGLTLLTPVTIHLFFPVIPAVNAAFGLSEALGQLAFSIGVFALAVSTLVYGSLADRWGRRPVLLAGLALFLAGCVIAALGTSFTALLFGRLVQAAGAGCGITLARVIARDVYGAAGLVKAIAYLSLAFALGGLLAPGIGGVLVDHAGWRSIFVLAGAAGVAAILGSLALIPRGAPAAVRGTPGTARGGSGLLELMRHPRFCALVIHTGASTATFFTLATASSVLMKETLHRPATEFGLYFAMVPIGFIAGTLTSSRLAGRVPLERMVLTGGTITLAAVAVQSALLLTGHLTPFVLFIPGTFTTFAQGLSLPFAQAGAMAVVPRLAATAAGAGVFMQNFMGAGAAQVWGLIADGTPVPLVETTTVMAVLGFAAALAATRAPAT